MHFYSFIFFIFKASTQPHPNYPNLRLVLFREASDVTKEDIERMTEKYDCGCKVLEHFLELQITPFFEF